MTGLALQLGLGLGTGGVRNQTLQQQVNALFSGGKKGFFFAPWELSTLFQERTGASATTPAVVDGAVGTIKDLSGNGNHAVAVSDGKRMLLKESGGLYHLLPDGIDDTYNIPSIALGTTQYEWLAVDQSGSLPFFMEHAANASGAAEGHFFYGSNGGPWRVNRSGAHYDSGSPGWANGLHVVEREYVATVGGAIFKDGTTVTPGAITGTARAEVIVTTKFNIGSRDQTSIYFDGKYYGHCLIGDAPSTADKLAFRQLFAEKAGVTL